MRSYLLIIILLIVTPVVLTGCFNLAQYDQAVIDKNQELSDKAKDKVEDGIEVGKEKLKDYTRAQIEKIVTELSNNMKESINNWIDQNDLNQYGDTKDTVYAGGSPLYDEATGQVRDKYEYILENNPDLIEKLNLEK